MDKSKVIQVNGRYFVELETVDRKHTHVNKRLYALPGYSKNRPHYVATLEGIQAVHGNAFK